MNETIKTAEFVEGSWLRLRLVNGRIAEFFVEQIVPLPGGDSKLAVCKYSPKNGEFLKAGMEPPRNDEDCEAGHEYLIYDEAKILEFNSSGWSPAELIGVFESD